MSNDATKRRTPRRGVKTAALVAAVFTLGAVGGGALVTSTDAWSHWSRWGGMKGRHADSAMWKEHARVHAGFVLDGIDATDEQREAIGETIDEAADVFAGALGEHRSLRREWLAELERPELDPETLEALRARHLEMADRKSRNVLDMVLRVGSVLTPEQRGELVSKFTRHRGGRRARKEG